MNFLPDDYEAPRASGNYMKLVTGENKFRVLSQPILGWLDWTEDKRPLRYRYDEKPTKSVHPKKPAKHFWAFVVWNYKESQIQILEIAQATIRTAIAALCENDDWGAPFAYDIKIMRKGDAPDVEYTVSPCPSKPVGDDIKRSFFEKPCNLEALFDGADPWTAGPNGEVTQPAFETIHVEGKSTPADQSLNPAGVKVSPLEELRQVLMNANLDAGMLEDFVEVAAKNRKKPIDAIIDAAMRASGDFKRLYADYLTKRHAHPVTS